MSSAPALDTGQAVRFLQNLQQQKTGMVFTNLLSSLTNPGSEEELLLPLRQLLLKHIISTYPPKVAIGHGQLSNEVFSPGKSHRRNHPHNLASTPLTACAEMRVQGGGGPGEAGGRRRRAEACTAWQACCFGCQREQQILQVLLRSGVGRECGVSSIPPGSFGMSS